MATDFDIYHYISTHLNGEYPKDNFQEIIDQRIEFAKKHKPILLKGDGYEVIPKRNDEKSIVLKGSNGDSIQYQFNKDDGKLIRAYINFCPQLTYGNVKTYVIFASYLKLFDITRSGGYGVLDSRFILLEDSKLPSDMLLGNIKTLLPMFYPFEHQEAFYSFDLMEDRLNYLFRIKSNKESHHNWSGKPINYSNIGYELGKYFHLLVSDIREIKGIQRENIEIRVQRMRGEI
jgi:hypothetical protein|nr:MAG TPA: hypothetical protein [Bacteriophage sp.]